MLKEELLAWVEKVCAAKEHYDVDNGQVAFVSTYAMIQEVDDIIAKAFDRDPVID